MAQSIQPVSRTSQGLVDALFDTIDKLNSHQIDAEQARAISHTARTIVTVAALELDFRKWAADVESVPLKSLVIDSGEGPPAEPAA
jgi:hypothetical protein